jgi:cold shock CspA family protein
MIRGVVETFDGHRGDGYVRSDAGEVLYFHCVVIADGSRSIGVGVAVQGRRSPGRLGRDEIIEVRTRI